MRTLEVSIYTFDELSDKAKQRAIQWWIECESFDPAWTHESRQSIEAFCGKYCVTLTNWSVGAWSTPEYSTDVTNANFRGLKLKNVTREEYPTGYCLDGTLSIAFYDELKRTGNALGAFKHALDEGFSAWVSYLEYQQSEESAIESIRANEYEFYADGEIV